MNTNLPPELSQIIPLLPPWYQTHWPALMLLAGIITHAAHRIVALGGLRGLWRLIWAGDSEPPFEKYANIRSTLPQIGGAPIELNPKPISGTTPEKTKL